MKNKYEIRGEIVVIFLTRKGKKYETEIDLDMLELVNSYPNTWGISGTVKPYVSMGIYPTNNKRYTVKLHRIIMNAKDGKVVDHMNGNTLCNLKSNMREVTQLVNAQNRSTNENSSSGFRGVTIDKRTSRWIARVNINGKRHVIGRFKYAEEANKAVELARASHMLGSIEYLTSPNDKTTKLRECGELNVRNKSGIRGVSWNHSRSKWQVKFVHNNVCVFVGRYDNLEDAKKALENKKIDVGALAN